MPNLIKLQTNDWVLQDADPISTWQTPQDWTAGQPLVLTGAAEPELQYAQASAIAIEFSAFTDGRGLSLAVLLRTRLGYSGELRAIGGVHEDVLHYMARCGFDAIELADDRDINVALSVMTPYSGLYQSSVTNPDPAFRRVHRGA